MNKCEEVVKGKSENAKCGNCYYYSYENLSCCYYNKMKSEKDYCCDFAIYDHTKSKEYNEVYTETELKEEAIKELEESSRLTKDNLNPSHYNAGKYDVIWFCEYHKLSFTVGNIIKYAFRAGKKDESKEIEDLKKARKYIDRRIEFLKGE